MHFSFIIGKNHRDERKQKDNDRGYWHRVITLSGRLDPNRIILSQMLEELESLTLWQA